MPIVTAHVVGLIVFAVIGPAHLLYLHLSKEEEQYVYGSDYLPSYGSTETFIGSSRLAYQSMMSPRRGGACATASNSSSSILGSDGGFVINIDSGSVDNEIDYSLPTRNPRYKKANRIVSRSRRGCMQASRPISPVSGSSYDPRDSAAHPEPACWGEKALKKVVLKGYLLGMDLEYDADDECVQKRR